MDSETNPNFPDRSSRLYTPLQVRAASFFGGPFAAVYTLHHNFKILENDRGRRLTLYCGGGFIIALCATIPFLPDKFPNTVIPLAYSITAGSVAASKQLTKEGILASQKYDPCSNWNVTGVSLISLIVFCAILFPLMYALDYCGVINLA